MVARNRLKILDGGTGAALQLRGVPADPVCWHARAALTHQAQLVSVHFDFIRAGAQVITTNTFASHRFVLEAAGYEDDYARINAASVAAARRARSESGAAVQIAGSMSCMPPAYDRKNYPDFALARHSYTEHAGTLAELGVDILALEMIQDSKHGGAALDAAIGTGLPVWLGLACRLVDDDVVCFDIPGTRLEDLVRDLSDREPALINIMHTPIDAVAAAIECLRHHWQGPIGVYPEVGSFDVVARRRTQSVSPQDFAAAARQWVELGATVIGGCCGALPSHIRALRGRLC